MEVRLIILKLRNFHLHVELNWSEWIMLKTYWNRKSYLNDQETAVLPDSCGCFRWFPGELRGRGPSEVNVVPLLFFPVTLCLRPLVPPVPLACLLCPFCKLCPVSVILQHSRQPPFSQEEGPTAQVCHLGENQWPGRTRGVCDVCAWPHCGAFQLVTVVRETLLWGVLRARGNLWSGTFLKLGHL